MIVVDASSLIHALIDDSRSGVAARQLLTEDQDWAAPDHVVIEVASAIRGRWLGKDIAAEQALDTIHDLQSLTFTLIRATLILDRVWELRHNLTTYDAAYVATAELLGCPLVTADIRLATAPGIRCEIRTVT